MLIRTSVYILDRLRLRGLLLLLLAVFAILLATGCYTIGVENSWIRVQNMGSEAANIEIHYFGPEGNLVTALSSPPIPPGGGWTFSEILNPQLPKGFLGSSVIISDQPIAVLMAKDVNRGGGFFQTAGDTVALSAGSDKLFLPLVTNRDGPAQDWNGRFVIQNVGDSTACATLVYLSNYTDSEVHWDPYDPSKKPKPTPAAECPDGGMPIPPNGSIFRSLFDMGVGPSFTGSVRVDLHRNAQGVSPSRQYIVATADIWNSNSRHFASYRGFNVDDMGTSILLPLMEREASYEWSTDFEIVNSDPSKPATVNLRIDGWDGSTNPPQFVVKQSTFDVRASHQCFQNNDWADCLAPGDNLPRNFYDGTARISSTQPIGVVVARSSNRGEVYVSYRGFRADRASKKVYLPLVNKNSLAWTRAGWNSWVRVMVADGGAANLTVRYIGSGLPGGQVSYTIPIFRTTTLIQAWDQALPDGFVGSAVLESDRPIVALGNVIAGKFPGDTDLMYNGVAGP